MTIKPVEASDWDDFYAWANLENWSVSLQEKRLFQNQWRPYFYVLWHRGRRCAFLSAVVYSSSAWIGNLIVDPNKRRCGYGSRLFESTLLKLQDLAKIERIWLTASVQGAPLYRKYEFKNVDRVERWISYGNGSDQSTSGGSLPALIETDSCCWGESRKALLTFLADDGKVIESTSCLGLLQPGIDFWQLGPWVAPDQQSYDFRSFLDLALVSTAAGKPLVADILVSSGATAALKSLGFAKGASNELMCLSEEPVSLKGVVALASLGSIG